MREMLYFSRVLCGGGLRFVQYCIKNTLIINIRNFHRITVIEKSFLDGF